MAQRAAERALTWGGSSARLLASIPNPRCGNDHACSSLQNANCSKHTSGMAPTLVHDLGSYLREQRTAAQLSLRQLSELAGISNPYLSQIERGLKKPSAEILQQIARALQVSAESLYVRAGILDAANPDPHQCDVLHAIAADGRLNDRQRQALIDVYRSFVGNTHVDPAPSHPSSSPSSTHA